MPTKKLDLLLGIFFVLISATGFSIMGYCGKMAYAEGLNTAALLAWRFILATLAFWPLVLLRKSYQGMDLRVWIKGLAMGAIGFWGVAFLYFTCIKYISTGLTSVLVYTYPSFVAFNSWLFLQKSIGRMQKIAILSCIIGCIFIAELQSFDYTELLNPGILLGLLMSFVYSLYIISGELVGKNIPADFLSATIITGSALSFSAQAFYFEQWQIPDSKDGWIAILLLAIFSTVVAINFLMMAIKRIGSLRTSILTTIEPVLTISIGLLFLDETLNQWQIIGGSLIFLSLLLSIFSSKATA